MTYKTYDKVKWHSQAESAPKDIPYEYGATHIAFIFRWTYENNLFSKESLGYINEWQNERQKSDFRVILIEAFDGVFASDEVNTKGKKFLNAYYTSEKTKFAKQFSWYLQDYEDLIESIYGDKENAYFYHEWNEENYQVVKKIIDERYAQFLVMTNKA